MADYRYLNSYFYFFQLHLLSSYSHMYSVMLLLTFLFSPERTCTSLGSLPLFHPIITPTAHLTTTLFYHLPTDTVQFLLTFSILYYRYNILSQDSHSKQLQCSRNFNKCFPYLLGTAELYFSAVTTALQITLVL